MAGINIYVGNLSFDASEDQLRELFEGYGNVQSAKIISDRFTGRSRGFGFVEMAGRAEAHSAIDGLNGKELKGRAVKVNEAHSRSGGRRGGARPAGGQRF